MKYTTLFLVLIVTSVSGYTCTYSDAVDFYEYIQDYVGSGSGSSGGGSGELREIVCPDGTTTYWEVTCLDINFKKNRRQYLGEFPRVEKKEKRQFTATEVECKGDELCAAFYEGGDSALGCVNSDFVVHDGEGNRVDLVTGEYELSDGTTGNIADGSPSVADTSSSGNDDNDSGSEGKVEGEKGENSAVSLSTGHIVVFSVVVAAVAWFA